VNIAGCAIFAAISGSSVATAAAIGTVALPQLMDRKYDRRISAGSLAAGGTLGILIPPSIAMIIYGNFTESSIAKLFMAGLIPGVVLAGFYMVYIGVRAFFNPALAPREGEPLSFREMLSTLYDLFPLILLVGSVLGSIYLGLATPTEAAAFGSSIAVVFSFIWGEVPFTAWSGKRCATPSGSAPRLCLSYGAPTFFPMPSGLEAWEKAWPTG
jgi:tripartite ATP-independent transporter DctM subunit